MTMRQPGKDLDDAGTRRARTSEMKDADFSPEFKRVLRFLLGGARFGLTGGFAVVSAELASWLTPARYAWLA